MKKRIISFALSLVMLFSCLSLGAFAEESLAHTHSTTKAPISHVHNIEEGKNIVTYICDECGESYTVEEENKMSYESLSGTGEILTVEEMELNEDLFPIFLTDFDGDTPADYGSSAKAFRLSATKNFEINDGVLKYNDNTSYPYVSTACSTKSQCLANKDYWGKSYTVSVDLKLDETSELNGSLFAIRTYLKFNEAGDTKNYNFNPLSVNAKDNTITIDGNPFELNAKGTFTTVTIQHVPEDDRVDFWLDGELKYTWKNAVKTKLGSGKEIVSTDGTVTAKVSEDFAVGQIRMTLKTGAYIDNFKAYYGENLDCKHKYTDSDTCNWCGKTAELTNVKAYCDICDGKPISDDVAVVGRSATLGELIDMNVYVKLANENKPTATLTCENKSASFDLAALTPEADGTYKLSLPLNSIYMAKNVTLEIDGGKYTTSIKEYAEELLRISTSEAEKAVAKALLNYGAAAQEYFAAKHADETLDDVLANDGLSDTDKAVKDYTAKDFSDYKFEASGMSEDVCFLGAAFILSSKTYMKVYFDASEDATVTVNGKTYTKTEDDGIYYVTVTIATPADAPEAFEIVITDGEAIAAANVSAYTAIEAALANPATDAKLVALLKAYADYCERTIAYVG